MYLVGKEGKKGAQQQIWLEFLDGFGERVLFVSWNENSMCEMWPMFANAGWQYDVGFHIQTSSKNIATAASVNWNDWLNTVQFCAIASNIAWTECSFNSKLFCQIDFQK